MQTSKNVTQTKVARPDQLHENVTSLGRSLDARMRSERIIELRYASSTGFTVAVSSASSRLLHTQLCVLYSRCSTLFISTACDELIALVGVLTRIDYDVHIYIYICISSYELSGYRFRWRQAGDRLNA